MIGKFKKFLINESAGLGDIGRNISQFYNSSDLNNKITNTFSNSETFKSEQPFTMNTSPELTIPTVEKTGRITFLMNKKNPIYIRLSDGTEASFSYDEYRKIEGDEPAIGKTMTIIFQRHPSDASGNHSKINKCIVRD